LAILEVRWDRYRKGVLEAMPALQPGETGGPIERNEISVLNLDHNIPAPTQAPETTQPSGAQNLLDFDLLMDPAPVVPQSSESV
jgi:hypothetical protein